jgi:uncharacterized protein (TIGR02466 family)
MPVENLKVSALFPTPLIEAMLPQAAARNSELAAVIRKRMETAPGVARSNILGWHSDTEMLRWGGEAAKSLALDALELCARFTVDRAMKEGRPRYEMGMEMWANVSPRGASNQMHAHPGSVWSAVYYVDDGGDSEATLTLLDPRFPMCQMAAPDLVFQDEKGAREETLVKVAPTPGKLVLFPAWLMHGVKPHNGPRERVSIAMNIQALPVRAGGRPAEGRAGS